MEEKKPDIMAMSMFFNYTFLVSWIQVAGHLDNLLYLLSQIPSQ